MTNYYEYKVSGKSITVRMHYFLNETIVGAIAGIENEKDKKLVLERVHRINLNLLRGAEEQRTPQNTIDSYNEGFDDACLAIVNKDLSEDE